TNFSPFAAHFTQLQVHTSFEKVIEGALLTANHIRQITRLLPNTSRFLVANNTKRSFHLRHLPASPFSQPRSALVHAWLAAFSLDALQSPERIIFSAHLSHTRRILPVTTCQSAVVAHFVQPVPSFAVWC